MVVRVEFVVLAAVGGDVLFGYQMRRGDITRRRFAREGAAEELDLDNTITGTARNAGWLDIKMRPERHNKVKVLLFLDVGGSMDDHIKVCEELFSAAKSEFKHLEYFYFHNCIFVAANLVFQFI